MTAQPGKQTITMHIASNISRNKGNQTVKFGQLIEYNIRNIFLDTFFLMFLRTFFPEPFLKTQN